MQPVIVANHLAKAYRFETVLRDVTLEITEGSFVALTGASGSGKSTLLRLLGGLETPDSGSVTLLGVDPATCPRQTLETLRREKIGFVFQSDNLLATMTLRDNIYLPSLLARDLTRERRERLDALMERVGIAPVADHYPTRVSGGEAQRAALVRALSRDPAVLFLDEPTGNLDAAAGEAVLGCLDDARRERPVTVVLVTHNPEHAARAGRILVLSGGGITHDETVSGDL